ncbi:MAG: TRC40/GET3/ArsA family transport-energizing ATPase [Prosthecochloris sp.]|uniref:arsenite-transporting ATPase n=1 Tax=Prosthecochloris aestuarii (strain DSM 271 / SK 413) TaxID=290512 RepID=B4S381_PROA2|nr:MULTISPECIES: TRC40/GET3/ArsA family transport-energizing ATPase [Prosthecochloris]ACF45175.1 arsenite-activated ATPase ArsA [Prosthecochloris aestuarii DSM 271]MCW8798089.1 TRC40/GET3/ArsA family transport-energizing ATPase [Prosthecochloris sp.]NEX12324.1 arsenic-transporting ATPase [Prosthecochloris sp.]RDD31167.1 arsenic-transporting ATPase [Prosthecochloris sp. ZM]
MRNIVFTGKGGVGKTTIAAATALKAAGMGYKTLVISTDPAHSLGDSFDIDLGSAPVKIADNLYGQEVSVYGDLSLNWEVVRQHFAHLMEVQGIKGIYVEEMGVLPGMEELFSLSYIKKYNESKEYDLLVIDCAPTGETLRLLSIPETFGWMLKLMRNMEKYVVKPVIRPISKRVGKLRELVPDEAVYDQVDNLFSSIDGIIELLSDSSKTTVRLVMNPEKMVIKESMRALTYLNLYGITVDQIVINRVMTDAVDGEYLKEWKEIQKLYIDQIEKSFSPIPITQVPLLRKEVFGLEMLCQVGDIIYDTSDPTEILYREEHVDIQKKSDGHYVMKLRLPFVFDNKMEANIVQVGELMTVRLGNYQKGVVLPAFLAGLRVSSADYEDKWLVINFTTKEETSASPERG